MVFYMNLKETYTKVFLKQAGIAITEATLKEHMPLWWQNTRDKKEGGLRLTPSGFDFLIEKLDLRFYEVPYPKDKPITTQTIIFLDKFINCPYFLSKSSIFVTDEKKSLELHLFAGDLRKYGLVKAMKRQS
tara:strand:+ start:1200 stop:1592 length:393 start_codon:yes stop_codon:yes gene_type:complete